MDLDDENDYEQLAFKQRLKAAVHYTVGEICEQVGLKEKVTFSKKFIAVLTELTFNQAQIFSTDVEHFANHAKRSVVNHDDVKLLIRRNPSIHEHIKKLHEVLNSANEAEKERKKKLKQNRKTDGDETRNILEVGNPEGSST